MRTRNLIIGAAVLWAAIAAPGAARAGEPPLPAEPGKPFRMLFAGSSSMYFHDMPRQVADWLSRSGLPATAEIAGRSGDGIHVYLRPGFDRYEYGVKKGGTFLDTVRDGKSDYVVLMVVARFITGAEASEHEAAVDTYCKAVRAAGGRPVIYEMGWGADEDTAPGRRKIFEAAVRNDAVIVPCSTAWSRARAGRPGIELHNPPDRTHPGTLGTYLNVCLFHLAFAGRLPDPAPDEIRIWPKWTKEEKAEAARKLEGVAVEGYPARVAGWMRPMSMNLRTEKIDPDTAAYLRKVAAETWADMQKRFAEARSADRPK